ncbi:LOW QUALITY PROTEIN: hypothetical protein HID58_070269 [Brassica napus]|uniref:Uncharacterized protein n=1 Tax=Brassica napus TaxID=3708 RepID=A0ABQ7YY96_BRANA|nr:LOW QUALITY PROTEIN: hypothetical protein HID58_070269 [Brassica napus]
MSLVRIYGVAVMDLACYSVVDGCQGCGGVLSLRFDSFMSRSAVSCVSSYGVTLTKLVFVDLLYPVSSEVNIITTGTATIRDCYYQSYLASGGTLWLSSSLRSQAMRNSQA